MSERPVLPLWPFIVADVLLLGLAGALLALSRHPLAWQNAGLIVICGALGAWSLTAPFLRKNEMEETELQLQTLQAVTGKIQRLDEVAAQVNGATVKWADYQDGMTKAAASARETYDRMIAESKALGEFMQRAGEAERNHLRLEVEKLRRGEGDRLQVVGHILDHVHALHRAARQSGQPALIEQIGQFQNACRDAARRIGLAPVVVDSGAAFDAKAHQLPDENATAPEGAVVEDTIIPGYTYQGQLLRRPMVALKA